MLGGARKLAVESRFFPLFAVLVGFLFMLYPLMVSYGRPDLLLNVFALTLFAVSTRAIPGGHRMVRVVQVLFVLMIAMRAWSYSNGSELVLIAYMGFSAMFQVAVTIVCLSRVMDRSPVDTDKILGAVCVYLLVGVFFAYLYEIIFLLDPGSFDLGNSPLQQPVGGLGLWVFSDFSFATLSTLGYGDILPLTAFTRSLATLEAVAGPLYLAILVAHLVSVRSTEPRFQSAGHQ